MRLSIIVAMTKDRVIGKDNSLPWRLSADLKRFKKITMGHALIMGRKTFESIGKPLPGRKSIVLTRDPNWTAEGVSVARSLAEALKLAEESGAEEAFAIGGSSVYAEALAKADRVFMTLVERAFDGDAHFPEFDLEKEFRVVERVPGEPSGDDPIPHTFITAIRSRGQAQGQL